MLPVLIHPICNGASRAAHSSPARSEHLIYTAATKEPLSPGIHVCSKINECSELKLGKAKGEVSLFRGKMNCMAESSRRTANYWDGAEVMAGPPALRGGNMRRPYWSFLTLPHPTVTRGFASASGLCFCCS